MADFCKQCSEDLFGQDSKDLADLGEGPLEPGYGFPALCEDCGPILVNEAGECIAEFCDKQHGSK